MSVIIMILLIGLLILVHELGHLGAALLFKVKVDKFGIGLPIGPTLWEKKVGNITLIVSAVVFVIGFVWLMRSRSLNKLALHTDVDSRLESSRDLGIKDGDEGIALSRLAPIGKAQFGNITVEAKSETEFIDEKTPVVIVRVEGYNVIVRRKE